MIPAREHESQADLIPAAQPGCENVATQVAGGGSRRALPSRCRKACFLFRAEPHTHPDRFTFDCLVGQHLLLLLTQTSTSFSSIDSPSCSMVVASKDAVNRLHGSDFQCLPQLWGYQPAHMPKEVYRPDSMGQNPCRDGVRAAAIQ